MSKNGNSLNVVTFMGARIAGQSTYTPSHLKAGAAKPTSAMVEFTVYQNQGEKKHAFKITAWGKMADVIARSGSIGKELQLVCTASSFDGRVSVLQPDGSFQYALKPDGSFITTKKIGFTLQSIVFGTDSSKTIANEIAQGLRPADWNVAGGAGNVQWLSICAQRNATQYIAGQPVFGNARVRELTNGAVAVNPAVANNIAGTAQVMANVAATLPAQPALVPVVGAPVIVNGQQMGYQMPVAPAVNPAAPVGGYTATM